MFAYKLKFILLPQFKDNYASSLPPLAIVNWSAFPECFLLILLILDCEMAPMDWRAPIWQWGPDMAPTVSSCLSRPCSGIMALCGLIWTS